MSTILIGVDASGRSEDAIAFGRDLAAVTDAHVVVACAFPYDDLPARGSNPPYREALGDEAERIAGAMRDRLDGIATDRTRLRIVANQSPAHALHDLAVAEHAEIIVVGSSHAGRFGRVTPGTTGERLLHGSPCAIAVVPHGYGARHDRPMRRIGVAYDASDGAELAVTAAVELARALDAGLEIIGVVAAADDTTSGTDVERDAQAALDAVAAELPAVGLCLTGDPAAKLGERSADLDLMLVGSRGYGPLRSVLVGDVSGRFVRTAACPVIVLPRGAGAPLGALFARAPAVAA
ncbi:universal stress protein [Solirubrobacter ginsenosidimutans]|uniref:Universal stress protein n=1 Tax=Solirubrobacter ginsenosidimutans TaxID=490573 RepID=A0A9X3S4L7_9ACTN|nr:universal stress protein [Solirubrobacter ginsenosidimutans]MDA0163246.1 universal stress protein [Solirubrobacter ginsenosidimutans]